MKFFAKKRSSFRVASKAWNRCLWRRGTEGSPALLGASYRPVLTQRFKIQVSQLGLTGTIFSPCVGGQLGTGSMAQRGDIQLVPPAVARPWWDEGLVRLGGVFLCLLWEWFREVLWDAGGWEIHAWGCSSGNVCAVICYSLLLCTTQVCPNESHPSCFQEDAHTLLFQGKGTALDRGIHFSSVVSFAKVSRHVDR